MENDPIGAGRRPSSPPPSGCGQAIDELAPTFEDVLPAYGPDLRRYLVRRLRDPDLAADLVQETLLRAYGARDRFENERPVWPWLAAIAHNVLLNTFRDERSRHERLATESEWASIAHRVESSPADDPERRFASTQLRATITAALIALTSRQRRILLLRVADGRSYEEIAVSEGVSVDAVKSALRRARRTFRAEFLSEYRLRFALDDEETTVVACASRRPTPARHRGCLLPFLNDRKEA